MGRQSMIAIGVAVVLGLFAVYLANAFLTSSEQRAEMTPAGMTRVAVAAVPLDYGVNVTPEKIRFVDFPSNSVPPGSFAKLSDLIPGGKSRVALRPIQVSEPILASKLTGDGQGASLAALLPDGMRAAAVRVNDVSGVAGFIQPNDTVDVLITRQLPGGDRDAQVTDLLLQNIRVIAIDQNTKNAEGQPALAKTATLKVAPVDAQKLALAQEVGSLSLVLRKPGQQQNNGFTPTVSMRDLRYGLSGSVRMTNAPRAEVRSTPRRPVAAPVRRARPVAAAPVERGRNVQIVRGTQGSDYEVGEYGS